MNSSSQQNDIKVEAFEQDNVKLPLPTEGNLYYASPKLSHQSQRSNVLHFAEDVNLDDLFTHNPDWFSFETRIRKMVIQMVEPMLKRSIQEKEVIQEMRKQNDQIKRKVDECEFIIHKAQKKTASQEDVNKKIENNEIRMRIHETKIKQNLDQIQHQHFCIEEKVDIVEQERSNFILRVENLAYENQRYKEELILMKEQLMHKIENSHLELRKSISDFNNKVEHLKMEQSLDKKFLTNIREDFKKFGYTIETNNRRLEEIEQLMQTVKNEKVDKDSYEKRMDYAEKMAQFASENCLKNEKQLQETDLFLAKYLPFGVQNQIDETLQAIFQTKLDSLNRLNEFQKGKFRELGERVMDLEVRLDKTKCQVPNLTQRGEEIERMLAEKKRKNIGNQSKLRLVKPDKPVIPAGVTKQLLRLDSSISGKSGIRSARKKVKSSSSKIVINHANTQSEQPFSDYNLPPVGEINQLQLQQQYYSLKPPKGSGRSSQSNGSSNGGNLRQQNTVVPQLRQQITVSDMKDHVINYNTTPSNQNQQQPNNQEETTLLIKANTQSFHSIHSQNGKKNIQEIKEELSEESKQESSHGKMVSPDQVKRQDSLRQSQQRSFKQDDELLSNMSSVLSNKLNTPDMTEYKQTPYQQVYDSLQQQHLVIAEESQNFFGTSQDLYGDEDDGMGEEEEERDMTSADFEEDSSESGNGIKLTQSMMERLQRRYIMKEDLDEGILDMFSTLFSDIQDLKTRVGPQFTHEHLQTSLDTLKTSIDQTKSLILSESQALRDSISTQQHNTRHETDQIHHEIMTNEKKRRRDQLDLCNKIDEVKRFAKTLEKQVSVLGSKENFYQNVCLSQIEMAQIDILLMQADEIDKKSISLMGVREDQPSVGQSPSVINLDKNCLSCSNQSYKILSAFKMACLSYFPSMVTYQQSVWSRDQLIMIKQGLLEECKRQIVEHEKGKRDEGSMTIETMAGGQIMLPDIKGTLNSSQNTQSYKNQVLVHEDAKADQSFTNKLHQKDKIIRNLKHKTDLLLRNHDDILLSPALSPDPSSSNNFMRNRLSQVTTDHDRSSLNQEADLTQQSFNRHRLRFGSLAPGTQPASPINRLSADRYNKGNQLDQSFTPQMLMSPSQIVRGQSSQVRTRRNKARNRQMVLTAATTQLSLSNQ